MSGGGELRPGEKGGMLQSGRPAGPREPKRKLAEARAALNKLALENIPTVEEILATEDPRTSALWWRAYELCLKHGVGVPKDVKIEGEVTHRPVVEIPARQLIPQLPPAHQPDVIDVEVIAVEEDEPDLAYVLGEVGE